MKGKKSRPLQADPLPTDTEAVKKRRQDTSHGAWGTVAEFRAQGREGLKQREEKVTAATAAKQAREVAAKEKREVAVRAAAGLEAQIDGGKAIESLSVAELRQLIVGRGGSVPTPSSFGRCVLKADLRTLVGTLAPMTAAQQALAMQAPSGPVVDEEEEPEDVVDGIAVAAAHPEALADASVDMDVEAQIAAAIDAEGV